jgi:N-acetylglucosaminyldiphosphoundecaprenol N-acetyl-beta-D-mannosaminyltransferase
MIIKTTCYNIHLTFGRKNVESNIAHFINSNQKGYVCVVDMNVIANTFNNDEYKQIVKNASFNTCDGSVLAFIKNLKSDNKEKLYSYNGPEIFENYINKTQIKQLLIGPNDEDFNLLKSKINPSNHLFNLALPFKPVDEFNYRLIADKINNIKPDLVWVLLGAPKQEYFISKIFPLVNKGLFLGTGAALDFYFKRIHNRSFSIFGLRFIWLERIFLDPKKQLKRLYFFLKVLPKIYRSA